MKIPKGWRLEAKVSDLNGSAYIQAIDHCGVVWYHVDGVFKIYASTFGGKAIRGRDSRANVHAILEPGGTVTTIPCPISYGGTITLPDGRKVKEGKWEH